MGQSPMGELELEDESPMGQQPDPPAGNPPMGDLNKTNHPPMGQQPTLLKEALGTNQEGIPTSPSPDPAVDAIATILRQELGTVDNDAAVRIVASCRAKAPDAKPREFEVLGRALAQRLKSIRSVDNPVGMMISRLVRSFEGDAFLDFREAARQAKEHEIRRCQFAINDPEEFETIKDEARARLAELENNDKD